MRSLVYQANGKKLIKKITKSKYFFHFNFMVLTLVVVVVLRIYDLLLVVGLRELPNE
jgi:hypothetical protein